MLCRHLAQLPAVLFPVLENVRPTPYLSSFSGFGHESQQICIKVPIARLASLLAETLLQDFFNHITSFFLALIYELRWINLFWDWTVYSVCWLIPESLIHRQRKETFTAITAAPVPRWQHLRPAVHRSLAIAYALGDRSHSWNGEVMERRGSGTSQSPLEWLCMTSPADEYPQHAECWIVLPCQACPGWEKHSAHIAPVHFWSQELKQFLLIWRGSSSE